MIRKICVFDHITAWTVYLGHDGLSALVKTPTSLHFVLITATRAMLQQCPVEWIGRAKRIHRSDTNLNVYVVPRYTLQLCDASLRHLYRYAIGGSRFQL
jgi:hypothetical protein